MIWAASILAGGFVVGCLILYGATTVIADAARECVRHAADEARDGLKLAINEAQSAVHGLRTIAREDIPALAAEVARIAGAELVRAAIEARRKLAGQ